MMRSILQQDSNRLPLQLSILFKSPLHSREICCWIKMSIFRYVMSNVILQLRLSLGSSYPAFAAFPLAFNLREKG